ncbi:MAG: D-glycero-beta-D-manno-heptose 1-phosphate adenylyltransferase [Deltaproteobacteria bacterium]|nr:D-glycero-beta-D-manno-heptose 1-phosphate adenylyltransferase [Deltaproteobacteria bacterium]
MRNKIKELKELIAEIQPLRGAGKRMVFTNGCFDILHVGHTRYLNAARTTGDVLIVGVNSDHSVRMLKGEKRPIVTEQERAEMLANLMVVDFVIIFPEETPAQLIEALRPDVIVKGGDWKRDAIVGADMVESWGGKVVIAPLIDGASTTNIIAKVLSVYAD